MVTGYDDDDDTSSCDENTETETRWGKLVWFMVSLSTILQLYRGSQLYWSRKPEKIQRPISQVAEKLYCIVLYRVHLWVETYNFSGDRH